MNIGDKIKTDLTYQTFGSEKTYFDRFIKDKELTVTDTNNRFITVLDENYQEWIISVQDLIKEINPDAL